MNLKNIIWRVLKKVGVKRILHRQFGYKIFCYTESALAEWIYTHQFDYLTLDFIQGEIKEDSTFIDIGANIGIYSLLAANNVGPQGRVIAFEPTPKVYQRLLENIQINDFSNISTQPIGLSDSTQKMKLNIETSGFDAFNSFSTPSMGKKFETIEVDVKKLDDFVIENEIHINSDTIIKIDVEGWEPQVIKGMKNILSRENAPRLLVEFTHENLNSNNFSCIALYDLISAHGYQLYEISKEELSPAKRQEYDYINLYAIKQS